VGGQGSVDVREIDRAEAALSARFLPLTLEPSWRGQRFAMRLDSLVIDRFTIGRVRFGTDLRIRTEAPTNYHVDIPRSGHARSRAGIRDEVTTGAGSAAVFMPGAPADLTWCDHAEQILLMFDPEDMSRELGALLGHEPRRPLIFAERMDLTGAAGRCWTKAVDFVETEIGADTGLLGFPLIARRLSQLLIDGLLIGHQHNYTAELSAEQPTPARRAVRCAVDLLQSRPEHPWTINSLAAAVAVSARSLQDGFRELTGCPPMTYLRAVRLQRAHEDLLEADGRTTMVSDVANRWGFVHLGRFAALYRQRYSMLPSETLRSEGSH
jgi:AraC-like DNA-binding protein